MCHPGRTVSRGSGAGGAPRSGRPRARDAAAAALFAAALGAAAAGAQQAPAAAAFGERVEIDVVEVEVFVTDKKGTPIPGLTAEDFEVFEDGKKVRVTHFRAPRAAAPGAGERPAAGGHVVLLVDNYTIDARAHRDVLAQLRDYVELGLQPGFDYAVASYDGYLQVRQPFTHDPAALLAAIDGLAQLSPLGIARRADRFATLQEGLNTLQAVMANLYSQATGDETARFLATYAKEVEAHAERVRRENEAAFRAYSHLVNSLGALPGRKAVLFVSAGMPMNPAAELYHAMADVAQRIEPDLPPAATSEARHADVNRRSSALGALSDSSPGRRRPIKKQKAGEPVSTGGLLELTALANASQVSFYTIKPQGNLGGLPAEITDWAADLFTPQLIAVRETSLSDTLRVMASDTGGEAVVGSDVDGLLGRAEGDLAAHYSLGYSPQHPGAGRYHQIEVKVRQKGNRVRHRKGYLHKSAEMRLADRASAALLLERDDNPFGLVIEIDDQQPAAKKDRWTVMLRVLMPLGRLAFLPGGEGALVSEPRLILAARDADGDTAPIQLYPLRIEVPEAALDRARGEYYAARLRIELREGPQRLAVGIVDPVAETASFVGRDLEIGQPAG